MSVVGSDFETLKHFNLAEIYDPTPKAEERNDAMPHTGRRGDIQASDAEISQTIPNTSEGH